MKVTLFAEAFVVNVVKLHCFRLSCSQLLLFVSNKTKYAIVLVLRYRPWISLTCPWYLYCCAQTALSPTHATAKLVSASTWRGITFALWSLVFQQICYPVIDAHDSMTKILKCASNDDCITIRAEDVPENVYLYDITFAFSFNSNSLLASFL